MKNKPDGSYKQTGKLAHGYSKTGFPGHPQQDLRDTKSPEVLWPRKAARKSSVKSRQAEEGTKSFFLLAMPYHCLHTQDS